MSDLLLSFLVLPFSMTKELMGFWPFGEFICNLWLSIDVLLCTASIWAIVAIALGENEHSGMKLYEIDAQRVETA